MRVRSRALGAGVAIALVYAATAILSGHLSPLARRPLLDGLAPPTAYRWVEPPPELASTNQEATSGRFKVDLGKAGSETASLTTGDAQVTLILPEGVFATAPGQKSIDVTVEPLAPSEVSPPDQPIQIVGNVYRLEGTYRPSGGEARAANALTIVLLYPLQANDHGGHSILWSRTGRRWATLDTDDSPTTQQVGADIRSLGYVAVGGTPGASPSQALEAGGDLGRTIWLVAMAVLAIAALSLFVHSSWAIRTVRRQLESGDVRSPSARMGERSTAARPAAGRNRSKRSKRGKGRRRR